MVPKSIFIVLMIATAVVRVSAQPYTLDKKVQPVLLNLIPYVAEDSAYNGKINITDVKQVVDTSYYYVNGLSIYQPVIFKIVSRDKKSRIKIQLAKDNWKKPDHTGSLAADGSWQKVFRTEGSFGIQVINPDKNASYKLMVWVGNEPKKIIMPSPFKQGTAVKTNAVAKPGTKKAIKPKKKKS
ncbi:MAG: hypothetical protein EOO13_08960 [Chitinophagaceae bacterium]|nr:MAG: hypothetical protein EOO13_08960 [Chitinophagaceae bacterium]